jgi:hypothetical protein
MERAAEIVQSWTAQPTLLPALEQEILTEVVWQLLAGAAVPVGALCSRNGWNVDAVDDALSRLVRKRRVRRDGAGAVIAARGLMIEQSRHRLITGHGAVYTQCSVDAIGIPAALGLEATVEDHCALCSGLIEVGVRSGDVASVNPPDAILLMAQADDCRDGEIPRMCTETNLFCSAQHARVW